jgi:thiaminase
LALAEELDWFERHLASRGLRTDAPLLPANRAYGDFLLVMAGAPYPAALIVAATAERAYYEAWSGVRPAAPAYAECVDRWTNDAFRDYVHALARATDHALANASPEVAAAAEDAFVWTARYEAEFWQMTLTTGAA